MDKRIKEAEKLWDDLDFSSKCFWNSGGRGGREGFIKYEVSKLY